MAAVEVEVVAAVKAAQALKLIAHGVGVDYVHNHGYALRVGVINQALEVLRGAEARTQREEGRNLVAEGAVVRVLLESHYLQDVIAQALDLRKHVDAEFLKSGHLLLFRAHSDVAFVNHRIAARTRPAGFPLVGRSVPHLGAEDLGLRVLDDPGHIGGNPLSAASCPFHPELVEIAVVDAKVRDAQLPVAVADRLELIGFGALPVVEVADEVYPVGVRGPLPDYPAAGVAVERIVEVVVDGLGDSGAASGYLLLVCEYPLVARIYSLLERLEPRVNLINLFCAGHNCSVFSLIVRK